VEGVGWGWVIEGNPCTIILLTYLSSGLQPLVTALLDLKSFKKLTLNDVKSAATKKGYPIVARLPQSHPRFEYLGLARTKMTYVVFMELVGMLTKSGKKFSLLDVGDNLKGKDLTRAKQYCPQDLRFTVRYYSLETLKGLK
jgi:hypothetical protein